jgi:hypothetical protein
MTKKSVKSSFTLPAQEVPIVNMLRKKLKLKSNTQVIRMALFDLKEKVYRDELRDRFKEASDLVKNNWPEEAKWLEESVGEGLEDEY